MPNQRKLGNQHPRICVEPKFAYTDGEDISELAIALGYELDPWQKNILNAWLGRDSHDSFTATTCGLSVARQQGKSLMLEMLVTYHLVTGTHTILVTAHEVKTARKLFLRIASLFERYDELKEICKAIRYANGQESITCEWLDDEGNIKTSMVEFSARSKGAARGYTVSLLILDEAQELTSEQMEALMPTLSAGKEGQRQVIMVGTPPYPNCQGDVFRNTRKNAINNNQKKGLCWHEWSVDEMKDPHDKKWWYETNPALGIRLTEEFTENEANTLLADGFNRQRLGYWHEDIVQGDIPINATNWEACATDNPPKPEDGIKCYAVKFSPDGNMASLAVCLNPKNNDKRHIEVIKYQSSQQLTWLQNFFAPIIKQCAQIIIDGKTKSVDLMQRLNDMGAPKGCVYIAKTTEVIAAASMLDSAINEQKVTHYNQEGLNESATKCLRRPIGNLGGWSWCDSLDTPSAVIESVALAYYASRKTKRNPNRKGRIR